MPSPLCRSAGVTPATTGAAVRVLIVTANGDRPRRNTVLPATLVWPNEAALLGFAVHRTQQMSMRQRSPIPESSPVRCANATRCLQRFHHRPAAVASRGLAATVLRPVAAAAAGCGVATNCAWRRVMAKLAVASRGLAATVLRPVAAAAAGSGVAASCWLRYGRMNRTRRQWPSNL